MIKKLKKALQAAGLDEGLAELINIASEDQIEGVVAKLKPTQPKLNYNEVIASEEFKDHVETTGFDAVIESCKPLKSGVDKKVTTGVNTFKDKMEKKKGGEEDSELAKQLQALSDKFDSLSTEKAQEEKLQSAKAALLKTKVPENLVDSWVKRINLDKSVDEQITALEAEYDSINEKIVGENAGKGFPRGDSTKGKPDEAVVDEIIEGVV